MSLPYSTQFVCVNDLAAWRAVYTVPAGKVAVVHTVVLFNGSLNTEDMRVSIQTPGSSATVVTGTVPASAELALERRLVLNAGDQLWATAGAGPGSIFVSGWLLTPS